MNHGADIYFTPFETSSRSGILFEAMFGPIDEVYLDISRKNKKDSNRRIYVRTMDDANDDKTSNYGPSLKVMLNKELSTKGTPLLIPDKEIDLTSNDTQVDSIRAFRAGRKCKNGLDYTRFKTDRDYTRSVTSFLYDNQMALCAAWYCPRIYGISDATAREVFDAIVDFMAGTVTVEKRAEYMNDTKPNGNKQPKSLERLINEAKGVNQYIKDTVPGCHFIKLDFGQNIVL